MKQAKNIFKNSGIRSLTEDQSSLFRHFLNIWIAPKDTFFTRSNVTFLSCAIGIYLQQKHSHDCNILIGTDTRTSGPWIKKQLFGIKDFGHHIFDAQTVPTPFIAQAIKDYTDLQTGLPFFQLGIIITASHNPAEFNGIKLITPDGYLTVENEIQISELFYKIKKVPEMISAYSAIGLTSTFDCIELYQQETQKQITHPKLSPNIKILLDCANGATSHIAKKIFQNYFPNTITINDDSNGALINKNSGCSNPALLVQTVQQQRADWGCAFDGDGDRVIIANQKGEIFDGDDILVIISQHPKFAQETTVVGTIMTNNAVEQFFTQQLKNFIRTDVGERNIICALDQYKAQLGSEACGHITFMNHARCSDGIFAALLFFETILSNPQVLQKLPKKFPQVHATIPLNMLTKDPSKIQDLVTTINADIIPGRIIARASNTEPVFRLMVEHPNIATAHQIITEIKYKILKTA